MRLASVLTYLWVALVVAIVAAWVANPSLLSEDTFATALRHWGPWAFTAFVIASLVRGALLVPSTPLVLAGGALFPDALALVLLVSVAGILVSAGLLYRFPGFAGYDSRLAARYPDQLARLQVHLTMPRATWFVALWAFLPVTPTDLICYAAGLVRMPFRRMITGIVVGKVPLVTIYVLAGREIGELLAI